MKTKRLYKKESIEKLKISKYENLTLLHAEGVENLELSTLRDNKIKISFTLHADAFNLESEETVAQKPITQVIHEQFNTYNLKK